MSGRRVSRAVLVAVEVADAVEAAIRFAAYAARSLPYSRIPLAFAGLLVVVSVPMLFRADMPSMAASSRLKCYDSAGNYVPCAAQARANLLPFGDQTTAFHQQASATTTALNQQEDLQREGLQREDLQREGLPTTALRQQESWQQESWRQVSLQQDNLQQASLATTVIDQQEKWKPSAPAARRSATLRKGPESVIYGRHLIPRFFSALRKKVTHFASVAAIEAGALPGRGVRE
ncbi:MAG TPA: hypothetical protein VMF12_02500 [Xanthobacteraceae bacterium]|nr:hypothetical protein [Xanthobacteraceae bacterium]